MEEETCMTNEWGTYCGTYSYLLDSSFMEWAGDAQARCGKSMQDELLKATPDMT